MDTVQRAITAEQVLQHRGAKKRGLEFLVEGQELGGFDLRFLQSFFHEASRFPPEEVQRFQGEDALSSILLAKEREQKLCLAEYELRVATEDLKHTKDQRGGDLVSPNEIWAPVHSTEFCSFSESETGDPKERKHLNSVVMAYLMQCGYKVTALTFQEEAFPEFDKTQTAGDTLSQYYHLAQESTNHTNNTETGDPPNESANSVASVSSSFQGGRRGEAVTSDLAPFEEVDGINTPDATQMKGVSVTAVHTDGDGDNEPQTPWTGRQSEKSPTIHAPSTDLLTVLMECLPRIVPNVLIKKRSDCIPVLAALLRDHPDDGCRSTLLSMLFNLIKHPDDEQRQTIVHGIGLLAECIGSQRITQEIIPQCCELANHKKFEKRLMVAEVIGEICDFVENEIRSSLLLSLLQQLSTDPVNSVRKSALASLLSCLKAADIPAQKQRNVPSCTLIQALTGLPQVEDLLIHFVTDAEGAISEAALSDFAPVLRDSKSGMQLNGRIVQRLFEDILAILNTAPFAKSSEKMSNGTVTDSGRLPKNAQQKTMISLLDLYCELLPEFARMCCDSVPFWVKHNLQKSASEDPLTLEADKELYSLDQGGVGEGRALSFEKWLDEEDKNEESKEIHVLIAETIPMLISCISSVAPVNECLKLREHLASATRATCQAFEWCVVEGAIKPLFLAASGLHDIFSTRNFTNSKVLSSSVMQRPPEARDTTSVFPICLLSILSEGGKGAFHDFILALFTPSDSHRTPWAIENKKEFVSAVVFSGGVASFFDTMSNCMISFSSSESSFVRCGAALMAEALCVHASYQDVLSSITPTALMLANDAELMVRLHAIAALQQISTVHPNASELMEKIYPAVEKLMTGDLPQVKLATLSAFSSAASVCSVHAFFVLKQIPSFLDELREATPDPTPFRFQLTATAVFDSLLVLEGVEILDSSLRSQLVSSMETLVRVASAYLDNAQRQILSAMVSDQTSKLGQLKKRIRSTLGHKRTSTSVSSDISCTSDASRGGDS